MLDIAEIFYSIQGEGSRIGKPCVFLRLQGCNLKCKWCDTEFAQQAESSESFQLDYDDLEKKLLEYNCDFLLITGGEPLLQKKGLIPLLNLLSGKIQTIAIETNGSISLDGIPSNIIKIMDIKCPSSGMEKQNYFANFNNLNIHDEIKFVIASRADLEYAENIIQRFDLYNVCNEIIFSPVWEKIDGRTVAEWILDKKLNVRMQVQLHKILWPKEMRGV